MARDPYEVLELERGASQEEIKKAYRRLVNKYHPDKYSDNPLQDLAQEKLKEINEAYNQLVKGSGKKGYSDYDTGSGGQHAGGLFGQVRQCINEKKIDEAERLLNGISEQNAEWHFLKGVILSYRGNYNQAYDYISRAHQMDPGHPEYRDLYYRMANAARGMGPQRKSSNADDCCTICGTMYCLSCCCDCMGEGLCC